MSSSSPVARIKELLEKTKNYDADERFMAMHDLVEALKALSSASLDASLQVPVRDTILRLLNDGSSDVATVSVKCLSQLVTKLNPTEIAYIAERLGALISKADAPTAAAAASSLSSSSSSYNDDDSDRTMSLDIVSDSLQTIISSSSPEHGKVLAPKLLQNLLTALSTVHARDLDRTMSCLTLLKALVERYGADIADQQKQISDCLLRLLSHPQDAVKKRASVTLGPLVYVLDDALFTSLMATLISGMDNSGSPEIFIQSVSAISKAAGVRVGGYLEQIIPRLSRFLTMTKEEKAGEEPEERRIELLETCLQAIEAVMLRCPTKVTPYVAQLVNTGIAWSTYDPMYSYEEEEEQGDDAEDDDMQGRTPRNAARSRRPQLSTDAMTDDAANGEEDGEGDWGEGTQNGADDDDWGDDVDAAANAGGGESWGAEDEDSGGISAGSNDTSWKVRRAAVGVLSAFTKARSDLLKEYYTLLIDHLIQRMKERDSAVKEELLFACRDLLHESVVADRVPPPAGSVGVRTSTSSPFVAADSDELPSTFHQPLFSRTRSTYAVLDQKTPKLILSVERGFTGSDIRTQQAIFAVLTELFQVRHGQLAAFIPRIIPHCINGVQATGKQASVNADALLFIRLVLESHTHAEVQPYLADLTSATIKSIRSGLPKNISAALAVLTAVASHLPAAKPASLVSSLSKDIFRVVFSQLEQNDVPLDVKLASISTMAVLLSAVGSELKADAKKVWPVFAERMSNESTCQPTLRATSKVASSGQVDCSAMVKHTDEMVSFLRKSSHHLRHNTVKCLESLLTAHPRSFSAEQVALIIGQMNPFIDDGDLQLTHLVLDLLSTILRTSSTSPFAPAVLAAISKDITNSAIQLACSPLLQGQSLTSLILFFQQLIKAKMATPATASAASSSAVFYPTLLSSLLSRVSRNLTPAAFSTLGKVIATITAEASVNERKATIRQMLEEVKKEGTKEKNSSLTTLALLFLGEVGRRDDLSYVDSLEAVLLASFNSDSESVRKAAAFALGNVTLGNMQRFLPRLLHLIGAEKRYSYLLLSALKEIIAFYSTSKSSLGDFSPYLDSVSPILFAHTDASDESTRAMVSECLGRLVVVAPSTLLSRLEALTRSLSPHVRAVCITALRSAFTPLMDYAQLKASLPHFMALVNDENLEVKRQTVLTINALFRTQVDTIDSALLSDIILPALFAHTQPVPALIREIDYGAFKSTVDDGKPLRKAAFQALATLLDVSPHRLNLHRLIVALQQGLTDQDDIQLSSYATYTQMAVQCPQVVLESLDQLPKLMMGPIKAHLQAAKGTKEPESAVECLRAVVRCMAVFNQMEGVELCTVYTHFFKQVCATPLLVQIIKETQQQKT